MTYLGKSPAYSSEFQKQEKEFASPAYIPQDTTQTVYVVRSWGMFFNIFGLILGLGCIAGGVIGVAIVCGWYWSEHLLLLASLCVCITGGLMQFGFSLACFSKSFLYDEKHKYKRMFFLQTPGIFAISICLAIALINVDFGTFVIALFVPVSLLLSIPYMMIMGQKDCVFHPYKRVQLRYDQF